LFGRATWGGFGKNDAFFARENMGLNHQEIWGPVSAAYRWKNESLTCTKKWFESFIKFVK